MLSMLGLLYYSALHLEDYCLLRSCRSYFDFKVREVGVGVDWIDDLEGGYYYCCYCYYHRRRHHRRLVTPLVNYYFWFDIWFDTSVVFYSIN